MRRKALAALLPALLAFQGCISFTTLVKIKPDGSGTIVQTITMSTKFLEQMKAMGSSFGDQKSGGATDMFSEKEARESVSKLGPGVTFVGMEKVKTTDHEGMTATYAFTDVTKLRISEAPDAPGSSGHGEEPLQFRFQKGAGSSTLTIAMHDTKKAEAKKGKSAASEKEAADAPPDPAAMAQMKELFKGMKLGVAVEVDGKLVKTNSAYVEGNKVTVLEMDFDALLDDPKALEKMAARKGDTLDDAKEILKDVKGIKVNLVPELFIEMR
ncbi:MAG: hypothetical protein U0166_16200 [Acidobacteriota bacterium]